MFTNTNEPTNPRERVEAHIKRGETIVWLLGVVREQVRAMEGQKCTKRLATNVEKRIKELRPDIGDDLAVHYTKPEPGSPYEVAIWSNALGVPYNDRFNPTICYAYVSCINQELRESADTIKEAQFVALNPSYFAYIERLPLWRDALERIGDWEADRAHIARRQAAFAADIAAYKLSPSMVFGDR